MLVRRDVLSDLGFPTSGKNGPIEKINWKTQVYEPKALGKKISYSIAQSPKDPEVFLIRTLWPPRENSKNFVLAENLLIAKDEKTAVYTHEITMTFEA